MTDEIDALGLLCPLPVLKLRKRLKPLDAGQIVRLLADDPAAIIDVPHFCNESGHTLIDIQESDAQIIFSVKKGG
jgi:tRNA 2-thiouridine synthesizing protein A